MVKKYIYMEAIRDKIFDPDCFRQLHCSKRIHGAKACIKTQS